jgi:hypothetical protein
LEEEDDDKIFHVNIIMEKTEHSGETAFPPAQMCRAGGAEIL